MVLRSPSRLRARLRTNALRAAAFGFASSLLSGCYIFAQHTYAPWVAVDAGVRRDGEALLASARAHARDNVVVDVPASDLARTRNRAVRETLLRYGLIARVGPSLVDWTARARRTLATCPYPDGSQPYIFDCRRLIIARLRTIALTSYSDDYTGFETGVAEQLFSYRFTAAPVTPIGADLARLRALTCSRWIAGDARESTPPQITWTPQVACAGSLARIWHPTLGDPKFVDLSFAGLSLQSGTDDFKAAIDRF